MSGGHAWDILLAGVVGDVVVQRAVHAHQGVEEDAVIRRGVAAAQVAEHLGQATPDQLQLIAEAQLLVDRRTESARQAGERDASMIAGVGTVLLIGCGWAALETGALGWIVAALVGLLLLVVGLLTRADG
jgi:CHASE3 domain sensor protein